MNNNCSVTHEAIQECQVALFMKKGIIHTNPYIILYILIGIPGSMLLNSLNKKHPDDVK